MNILVVDDERNVRESLERYLRMQDLIPHTAASAGEAQNLLLTRVFDLILLDLRMPGMNGIELLAWLNQVGLPTPVIMLSAHGEIDDAVQALRLGARDYLAKPYEPDELIIRIQRCLHEVRLERRVAAADSSDCYWGNSPENRHNQTLLGKAAATKATVLLTGESGTGKELTARWIHNQSPRREQVFLPINLASLPRELVESELFGYEAGAFTGAERRHEGIFEAAQGGTLLLDEIGEMPLAVQAAFLRVLQEGTIRRIGNPHEIPVDVRIVCATNRDLPGMVHTGEFREDLYYRLNVIPACLPPLRQRTGDIPELSGILLKKIAQRLGLSELSIDPAGIELLLGYDYPGNIRELENILERCAILAGSPRIPAALVQQGLPGNSNRTAAAASHATEPSYPRSLKEMERRAIHTALQRHNGNRTHTASELGITRKTLIQKIRDYQLE